MKLIYVANYRLPTEKAHGIQIAKMCQAFADQKVHVELLVPSRRNNIKESIFEYYGVKNNFDLKYLPTIDLVGVIPKLGFWLQSITFAKSVKKYLSQQDYSGTIFSRDLFSLWLLRKNENLNLVYEMHNFPKKVLSKHAQMFDRIDKFVCITKNLKKELIANGIDESKIVIAESGVDVERFSKLPDKQMSRQDIGIDKDAKVAMYIGHLYDWKGIDTIVETAKILPEYKFYVVGGTEIDQKKYVNAGSNNLVFLPHQKHADIPKFLSAAHVLLLPNSAKQKISQQYTSPLKMFEYMASGKPIVASDLPSIREVLSEKNAVLVTPDNAKSLAEGIKSTDNKLAAAAQEDVQVYDWSNRARKILDFIS